MLLDLECSRGQVVSHLLSSVIVLDCNIKLTYHSSLLPSLALPAVLALEAYHWVQMCLGKVSHLLARSDELAARKGQRSLEEALVKTLRVHLRPLSKPRRMQRRLFQVLKGVSQSILGCLELCHHPVSGLCRSSSEVPVGLQTNTGPHYERHFHEKYHSQWRCIGACQGQNSCALNTSVCFQPAKG